MSGPTFPAANNPTGSTATPATQPTPAGPSSATPPAPAEPKLTGKITQPDVDGRVVSNPVKITGEASGSDAIIRLCGHKLFAVATLKDGKFEAIFPTMPTGPFQFELWTDNEMVHAVKVDVKE